MLKDIINSSIKLEEATQALLLMSKVPKSYSTMVSAIMALTKLKELKIRTFMSNIIYKETLCWSSMGQSDNLHQRCPRSKFTAAMVIACIAARSMTW